MKQKIKKDFEKKIQIGAGQQEKEQQESIFLKKTDLLSQDVMMKLKIGFKAILYNFDYIPK